MSRIVTTSSVTGLLLALALAAAGCSRDTPSTQGAFTTELKAAPPPNPRTPVGKVGVADDGVKPAPVPAPLPGVARGGIADDGIKPAPLPTITKGGVIDDSVKPRPPGPAPTSAPR